MLRITTWNVNGLRAAVRKGFRGMVETVAPDVLLLQEIRCRHDEVAPEAWAGFHASFNSAERAGYSGTALWSRSPHTRKETMAPDTEGRVLVAEVGAVTVVSVYLPSGSAGAEAQARKDQFCSRFLPWSAELAARGGPVVLGGDLNVAPTASDIHDPKGNARNSGFLPHERAWFAQLLGCGWTDLVRTAVGPKQGPWTWWSNRGRARIEDRGWRIDHLLGNEAAAACLVGAGVLRDGGLVVSDHAPVWVDLSVG